jgi:hypothetical protein
MPTSSKQVVSAVVPINLLSNLGMAQTHHVLRDTRSKGNLKIPEKITHQLWSGVGKTVTRQSFL